VVAGSNPVSPTNEVAGEEGLWRNSEPLFHTRRGYVQQRHGSQVVARVAVDVTGDRGSHHGPIGCRYERPPSKSSERRCENFLTAVKILSAAKFAAGRDLARGGDGEPSDSVRTTFPF
jgi:hypothetical protein